MSISQIKNELQGLSDIKQAKILSRFFKTGKGDYGEGDIFLGIKVPIQRQVAKKYIELSLKDLEQLLNSKIHEYRLIALFILILKYKKVNEAEKTVIFNFYLKNIKNRPVAI